MKSSHILQRYKVSIYLKPQSIIPVWAVVLYICRARFYGCLLDIFITYCTSTLLIILFQKQDI